jgi:hypothetical protein
MSIHYHHWFIHSGEALNANEPYQLMFVDSVTKKRLQLPECRLREGYKSFDIHHYVQQQWKGHYIVLHIDEPDDYCRIDVELQSRKPAFSDDEKMIES